MMPPTTEDLKKFMWNRNGTLPDIQKHQALFSQGHRLSKILKGRLQLYEALCWN